MNPSIGDLEVRDLKKVVSPQFRLGACFVARQGERVILAGRSGSGKTTLLRMLAGLEVPDSGTVHLGGRELTRLQPRERDIGLVFQEHALFPALNVIENVSFGLVARKVAGAQPIAMDWLGRVGMAGMAKAPIGQLSGGERQRVAFLRAIIWKPRLLLLDEPFSALDSATKAMLSRELISLHEAWPVPMIVVTHDEHEIEGLATGRLRVHETEGGKSREVRRE